MRFLLILMLMLGSFLMSTSIFAQSQSKDKKEEQAKVDTTKKVERTNTKILLDKFEITGKIEKPQTAFIIQGQEQSVEDIHIDRSFFREMFRKIEREDMKKLSERRRAKQKNRK